MSTPSTKRARIDPIRTRPLPRRPRNRWPRPGQTQASRPAATVRDESRAADAALVSDTFSLLDRDGFRERDANGRAGGRSSARCARPRATLTWLGCSSRGSPSFSSLLAAARGPGHVAGEVMPLDQVRPGMEGVGRTVFEGATRRRVPRAHPRASSRTPSGPRQSLILARLEGGPLAQTGVIAGHERQPRLRGRQADRRRGLRVPVRQGADRGHHADRRHDRSGAKPGAPRAASARLHLPGARGVLRGAARPRVGRGGPRAAAARRSSRAPFAGEPLPPEPRRGGAAARSRCRSSSPASTRTRSTGRAASSPSMGFAPVMGGGGGRREPGPLPDLAPGAAVGVSLVEGDLDLSVTGTVTHIDRDRVYAFGHPFYNLGPTQFPAEEGLGATRSSRASRCPGRSPPPRTRSARSTRTARPRSRAGSAPLPRMIPRRGAAALRRARASASFRFRMVEDELLTPLLGLRVAALGAAGPRAGVRRRHAARRRPRLPLAGGREVRVERRRRERAAGAAGGRRRRRAARAARRQRLREGGDRDARR